MVATSQNLLHNNDTSESLDILMSWLSDLVQEASAIQLDLLSS